VGAELAQHIFQVDQRRSQRDEIFIETRIRRCSPPYGDPAPAYLLNVSRFGFMVRTSLMLIDGSLISIELPELGQLVGRTTWSMEQNIGAEFFEPLDPTVYFNLLSAVASEQRLAVAS
jgi:hypothetical protein